MEIESQSQQQQVNAIETTSSTTTSSKTLQRVVLVLSFALLILGGSCTPLLLRLYFLKGGTRKWLSCCLQTAGFPLILIPLSISYIHRRKTTNPKPYLITRPLFIACTVLGILFGIDDFMYAHGMSYLPVSTSSLLLSTQLGFTALFAFFLVRQKFTSYSINAVVLLTLGAVLLGIHSNGDRPQAEGMREYYVGFVMTVAAAVLYGLIMPLLELTYAKAKTEITYTLMMEMQLVMAFFATVFSVVGMAVNKDFQAIPKEAREFESGEMSYYMVLVWSAILSQFYLLGIISVIQCTSALLSGIVASALIPISEVLALIFFQESFNGGKGVAVALSIWGFISYFYGEFKVMKKERAIAIANAIEAQLKVSIVKS